MPRGTDQITLNLQLESNDFVTYYVTVKGGAAPHVLWRTADVEGRTGADGALASVTVPAAILAPGRYILELTGRSNRGTDEPIASYPLDVVIQ